jgi:hypothetical protein
MLTSAGVPPSRLTAESADASGAPEERLRSGRAQAEHEGRVHGRELQLEPVPAGLDLGPAGLVVDPPLVRRPPLEVLDRVREVHALLRDLRFFQQAAEQPPGGPDERAPGLVLDVAGLFSDEQQPTDRSLSENGLRRPREERAARAVRRLPA